MNDSTIDRLPWPRQFIQPKTVWNDKKGRTLVCLEIWDTASGYEIELLIINGEKHALEIVKQPWASVHRSIERGHMQRAIIE